MKASGKTVAPLVSVAMITYNHREYIHQSVESILSQQVNFPFELVIGEDFSTDGTREMVFKLQKKYPERIRLVSSESNVGAHRNAVRTEQACRGKYVAFCEGDDFWNDPSKLAKQIAFLEARPDYSMVHSHCNRYFVEERRLARNSLTVPRGLDDGNAFEEMLLGRRVPLTVTVVARLEKVHWAVAHCPECTDPTWPMRDTQMWLELSRLGKVGCIHEPLATTNVLAESAGQSRDPLKRLKFYLAARKLQLHYLDKYPVAAEVDRVVREKLALTLLWHAFVSGNAAVADEMYSDFVARRGRPTLRARWLRWGSRSPFRRRMVSPLVKAESQWQRIQRRLTRSSLTGPAIAPAR